jgi:hypothetical protein
LPDNETTNHSRNPGSNNCGAIGYDFSKEVFFTTKNTKMDEETKGDLTGWSFFVSFVLLRRFVVKIMFSILIRRTVLPGRRLIKKARCGKSRYISGGYWFNQERSVRSPTVREGCQVSTRWL